MCLSVSSLQLYICDSLTKFSLCFLTAKALWELDVCLLIDSLILSSLMHLTSLYFISGSLVFPQFSSSLTLTVCLSVSVKQSHPQWALSGSGSTRQSPTVVTYLVLDWFSQAQLNPVCECVCMYVSLPLPLCLFPSSILTSVTCPISFVAKCVCIFVYVCLCGNKCVCSW